MSKLMLIENTDAFVVGNNARDAIAGGCAHISWPYVA
jgi:hypothetical protein